MAETKGASNVELTAVGNVAATQSSDMEVPQNTSTVAKAESVTSTKEYKQKASFVSKSARHLMSRWQKKVRYKTGGFDLDLTYITPRIIAMSFPASGLEAVYRNNAKDVAAMLVQKHGEKFMIINVAEKSYPSEDLNNQVLDFGWPDHMAPSMEKLLGCVQAIDGWNRSDSRHVAVVHCKGGKGRTGVIIAAYMLVTKNFIGERAPEEAMDHFAITRFASKDPMKYGISGKAQRRYVKYFYSIIQGEFEVWDRQMFLESITINGVPDYENGGCRPYLKLSEFPIGDTQLRDIFEWPPPDADEKTKSEFNQADGKIEIPVNMLLKLGDIVARCYHTGKKKQEPIWRLQFHMCTVKDHEITFTKAECDDVKTKDTRFAESSSITFKFCPKRTPDVPAPFNLGAALAQAYSKATIDLVTASTTEKANKASSESIQAMENASSEEERLELMRRVRDGELTVNDAVARSLGDREKSHRRRSVTDEVLTGHNPDFSDDNNNDNDNNNNNDNNNEYANEDDGDGVSVAIGDTVRVDGYDSQGVVRFIGHVHAKDNVRVGVELSQPEGKNNGTVDFYEYFTCAHSCGVLVRPHKVHLIRVFDVNFEDHDSDDPFATSSTPTTTTTAVKATATAKLYHRRSASDLTTLKMMNKGLGPNPFEITTNNVGLQKTKKHIRSASYAMGVQTNPFGDNPSETPKFKSAGTTPVVLSPNPFANTKNPFSDVRDAPLEVNPFASSVVGGGDGGVDGGVDVDGGDAGVGVSDETDSPINPFEPTDNATPATQPVQPTQPTPATTTPTLTPTPSRMASDDVEQVNNPFEVTPTTTSVLSTTMATTMATKKTSLTTPDGVGGNNNNPFGIATAPTSTPVSTTASTTTTTPTPTIPLATTTSTSTPTPTSTTTLTSTTTSTLNDTVDTNAVVVQPNDASSTNTKVVDESTPTTTTPPTSISPPTTTTTTTPTTTPTPTTTTSAPTTTNTTTRESAKETTANPFADDKATETKPTATNPFADGEVDKSTPPTTTATTPTTTTITTTTTTTSASSSVNPFA